MKISKVLLPLFLLVVITHLSAQTETITYELNGRNPDQTVKNPFGKFIGEWTLKNDDWTQNWGNGTETIKIPGHHTITRQLNTDNSLLSIIDGPEPNGHIFWSYNPKTGELGHLSSFGSIRSGKGKGKINEQGDVELKLTFEGETPGTYRIYNYQWINEDEYHMKSVQFSENDQPTGLFYEGYFVRIKNQQDPNEAVKNEVLHHGKVIREAFGNEDIDKIKALHHPNVIKALGYHDLKTGRDEVMAGLKGTLDSFTLEFIENDVESILIQDNMAIEQTKFSIKGTPKNGGESWVFSGRTVVTYIRYDDSPTGWATIREVIQPATQ
ncbi:MAG: nuclear transport factor 2 family protein [Bacteroidota bacterium]